MNREVLIAEALQVGVNAKRNMLVIRKHPEKIRSDKKANAMKYLDMMSRFAEAENKNARLADRTWLKNICKTLLTCIVTIGTTKCKKHI